MRKKDEKKSRRNGGEVILRGRFSNYICIPKPSVISGKVFKILQAWVGQVRG